MVLTASARAGEVLDVQLLSWEEVRVPPLLVDSQCFEVSDSVRLLRSFLLAGSLAGCLAETAVESCRLRASSVRSSIHVNPDAAIHMAMTVDCVL